MAGLPNSREGKQLARSPFQMLKRAAQYASQLYMDGAGKSGLTQRQFTVLLAVDSNDGISQTALVKLTGIDRSTLADLVSRMMAQGYLQRRRTKDDGRTNSIRITPAGKKALKGAQPGADDVDKRLLSDVPSSHRKAFQEVLSILTDKMDALEKADAGKGAPKPSRRRKA
jgi:MarR family transcriptional regulator, temperature-dependent positive regulator of motility